MQLLGILLSFNALRHCLGFHVRDKYGRGRMIKTHASITEVGMMQALMSYIYKNKLAGTGSEFRAITDFYKTDQQSLMKLSDAVNTIIDAISVTESNKRDVAYVHCHGEQILLAHKHVIACREKMKTFQTDIQELRRLIGECLYTVQSFYSNTNWVEMYGATPYLDFGVKGKTLMAVANSEEDTCKDMPDPDYNCSDNIIIREKLTSGYNHYRGGNMKPFRPRGALTGKCSHGGYYDDSRKDVAKCGINKETPIEQYSPHYHLHFRAYSAAVAATEQFLVGKDSGVLYQLGSDVFDSIFHIKVKKEVSLAFAVDNTGSMTEEISAVRETVTQLVTSTFGSENEPVDYVLSLFNDPVELNKAFVFKDGFELIKKLENVEINGGDDCPEFAADGIYKAIQLSREGSTLFVFTDADAKDENRRQEVESAAIAKNITITIMLTGQCSRKRRSYHYRHRRATAEFFQHLALATGGTVYNSTKENIGTIAAAVIEEAFPTAEIIVHSFLWPSLSGDSKQFVVDSSITNLKITVGGISSFENIELFYPNGTLVTFTNSKYARMYTSKKGAILSLQNPPPKMYTIRRKTSTQLQINITAQSTIQASYYVLDMVGKDSFTTLKGNPIVDKTYRYVFDIFGQYENWTCSEVFVTDMAGNLLSTYTLTQTLTTLSMQCVTDIITPNQVFQLKINGSDMNGYSYTRTMSTEFRPTNIELKLLSETDAILGKNAVIIYHLMNTGTNNDTYKVDISDDYLFLMQPIKIIHSVNAGESVNGSFVFKPTIPSVLYTYTVTVSLASTSETIQRIIKRIAVTNVEKPTCNIPKRSGLCNNSSLEIPICNQYQWYAQIDVLFSGTELDLIDTNTDSTVILEHINITGLRKGPVNVNISGTCCTPILTISVIDIDGFIAQCHLDFSNGQLPRFVNTTDVPSTPSAKTESVNIGIIVAIVVTSAAIIFVVIGTIVYKRITKFSNYSVQRTGNVNTQSKSHPESSVTYQVVRSTDPDNLIS